jgi:2-(3-amino-3-carboxypropyl)histidine synthase
MDLTRAAEQIRRRGAKIVGLQVPEGLKRAAFEIARQMREQTGAEVIISGDPCYGSCDIDTALCSDVDLMIHLGHAAIGDSLEKIIFLEAEMPLDLEEVTKKAIPYLQSRTVGVTTTVQHVHRLDQAIEVLRDNGITGLVGPATGRIKYPGQVLGCCYSTAKPLEVDEFLFIGTGQFHPIGIALATGKRVIAADPASYEVSEIDADSMLRRRFGAITRASGADRFAVLVSKKPGQRRMEQAWLLKALGESCGKDMILVYLDNIEPDRLLNLGIKAAICTACPRVALDDSAKFGIPILTPPEFEIMLGKRHWEDYRFDEIEICS